MAVLQMRRVNICGMKKTRKAVLERLQALGMMEMNLGFPDEGLEKMDTTAMRNQFEKSTQQIEQALEVLQKYVPEKKSLFSGFEGKTLIGQEEYEKLAVQAGGGLSSANQILSLDKQIAECRAEIIRLENQKEALVPWMKLDVPLGMKGTKKTALILGTVPGTADQELICRTLAERAPQAEGTDVEIHFADKDQTCISVLCLKKDAEAVEEALRSIGFARPALGVSGLPSGEMERMEAAVREKHGRIGQLIKEIEDFAGIRKDLEITADYYRNRADKYQLLGKLPQSKNVYFISGYVPAKTADQLVKELQETYGVMAESTELAPDEEAPVLLQNNSFAQSGEGILNSFGLPAKGEIDPTSIMTVFYVFLFGLMLSDAAYGLIVSLVCGILLKKYPRMGESLRKSIKLFFWCGLSTLFWGVMFGGYFGDAVDVISQTFFGTHVTVPAVWFVPLNDPMKLLVYAMLFGVIHMYTGMAIKGYICLRDKRYVDFICDVVLWLCLLTGLILMLLPSSIFASVSQMYIVFPEPVNLLAKGMAIGGAVGILLMSGRRKKNKWGLRLALGAYDLYGITSWLSDVLSYSRLLALGLATGVIASVFNQMGSMFGGGVLGAVIFIIVFVVGHVFNIGINLLGAYVHTCRLQYVEFFGKFYEGGGREFNPFKSKAKYVEIKEETKL